MPSTRSILIATVTCVAVVLAAPAAADKDDVVSARVRTALVAAAIPEVAQIEVQVFKGEVELSGFVDSADSKAAAARVAGTVQGVTSVRNDLTVHEL